VSNGTIAETEKCRCTRIFKWNPFTTLYANTADRGWLSGRMHNTPEALEQMRLTAGVQTAESVHTGCCSWHSRALTTRSLQSATVVTSETFVPPQRDHRSVTVLHDNTCPHVARTLYSRVSIARGCRARQHGIDFARKSNEHCLARQPRAIDTRLVTRYVPCVGRGWNIPSTVRACHRVTPPPSRNRKWAVVRVEVVITEVVQQVRQPPRESFEERIHWMRH
jgi:hypothetical protein